MKYRLIFCFLMGTSNTLLANEFTCLEGKCPEGAYREYCTNCKVTGSGKSKVLACDCAKDDYKCKSTEEQCKEHNIGKCCYPSFFGPDENCCKKYLVNSICLNKYKSCCHHNTEFKVIKGSDGSVTLRLECVCKGYDSSCPAYNPSSR